MLARQTSVPLIAIAAIFKSWLRMGTLTIVLLAVLGDQEELLKSKRNQLTPMKWSKPDVLD